MKRLFALLFVLALVLAVASPVMAGENFFITLHQQDWIRLGLELTGFCGLLTNFTKTDVDNRAVGFISKLIHFFAGSLKVSGLK